MYYPSVIMKMHITLPGETGSQERKPMYPKSQCITNSNTSPWRIKALVNHIKNKNWTQEAYNIDGIIKYTVRMMICMLLRVVNYIYGYFL